MDVDIPQIPPKILYTQRNRDLERSVRTFKEHYAHSMSRDPGGDISQIP